MLRSSLLLAISAFLASGVSAHAHAAPQAAKMDGYPGIFQLAPVNSSWAKILLEGASIPDLPLTANGNPVFDISKDVRSCSGFPNSWALTYDDGPSAYSDLVLNSLGAANIKAAFFVTGSMVVQYPEVLKKMSEQGHEIGIHTWSHKYSTSLSNEQLVAEIVWAAKAIYSVTGKVPRMVRTPFGDLDDRVRAVIRSMGLVNILWDADTSDAGIAEAGMGPAVDKARAWQNEPRPDGILSLEHDLYQFAAQKAGQIIDIAKGSKFTLVKVSDCISKQSPGGPYLNNGKFFKVVTGLDSINGESFKENQPGGGTGSNALKPIASLLTLYLTLVFLVI